MNPETLISAKRPFPVLAVVIILLILGVSLAVYYFNRQKIGGSAETLSSSSNFVRTEIIAGQVVSFKDNLLIIKKDNGQETRIKIAQGAIILKQKRLDPENTTSVSARIQTGDKVSVQNVTGGPGKGEANMVLILDDTVVSKETKQ